MAEKYNCSKKSILSYAKKIGFKNEYIGSLNETQKQEIIKLYETKSSAELAKEYGVHRGQITKIWFDQGLCGKSKNRYYLNDTYFENIDTPDKAYFVGLLASDGNVFKRKNGDSKSIIKISLQKQDRKILDVFRLYIESDKPIYEHERDKKNHSDICTFEIVSDKIANDLLKYNITQNKTYVFSTPILPKELMSHYFRGYFDGDGSITCANNKLHTPSSYVVRMSGYIHNLEIMKSYLEENENIKAIIIRDNRKEKYKGEDEFGSIAFPNISETYNFLNYIYKDRRDIFLPRKRYLAECFINAIKQNYSNKEKIYNNVLMPS